MFDMFEKWDGNNAQAQEKQEDSSSAIVRRASVSVGSFNPAKTVVLSVGGSLFFQEEINVQAIEDFCNTLNELINEGYAFVLVIGGGRTARDYQEVAFGFGASNYVLDEIGIRVTQLNASIFTLLIQNAYSQVMQDTSLAREILSLGRIPIFGGTIPGQTTDGVGALIAENLGCDFINLSNVDGVFSADPKRSKKATMFTELSYKKMLSLLEKGALKPGAHSFSDLVAAKILARSNLRAFFLSGTDLANFRACVRGEHYVGTVVSKEIVD